MIVKFSEKMNLNQLSSNVMEIKVASLDGTK